MRSIAARVPFRRIAFRAVAILVFCAPAAYPQASSPDKTSEGMAIYQELARFQLSGASAPAENVVLKHDRAQMSFSGTFYFDTAVAGKVRGAVFVGSVHADVPSSPAEQDNLRRMLHADAVDANFMAVANEHFATTALAKTYQIKDLSWFFRQWVYEYSLPSYDFSYWVQKLPDGTAMVHGTVYQRNAPPNWFMPLPLVVRLGKDRMSRGLVMAAGPGRPATLHVPAPPESIELDPDRWVLSEKTTTTVTSPNK